MRSHLKYDEGLQTFFADQEIENAYQILKPYIDSFHEAFITDSLESEESKNIPFSGYFEEYKNKKERGENSLSLIEKQLRVKIGELYNSTAEQWKKNKHSQFAWKKGSQEEKSFEILSSQDLLRLIRDSKSVDNEGRAAAEKILNDKFFTYFGGFNQNRANYYTTKDEKTTAVATRIIHENLPKFCDNIICFDNRRDEYLSVYDFLKHRGNALITKERKRLVAITQELFIIDYFVKCLSQRQIEKYNEQIGNANFLINLYNQAKREEEGFKRLSLFKTLYKQIGCGKKDPLFFQLTHDTKKQAQENKERYKKPYSVEQILGQAQSAGNTYFKNTNNEDNITTIPDFLNYILQKQNDNYEGIYWSRAALNTISNKYFSNWYFLKEQFKDKKTVASFDKKREEQIKINDAVELSALFETINQAKNWKNAGVLFKESLFKLLADTVDNKEENKMIERRIDILIQAKNPAEALVKMIIMDIEDHMSQFLASADSIQQLSDYHEEKNKGQIKQWLDHALAVVQMMKYFLVREDKTKGRSVDAYISNTLKYLLFEKTILFEGQTTPVEWLEWYDVVRNYLTKKPQEDAKRNKLKLNFENSTLAKGWDVNKEPDNYCIILQDQKGKQYLAIIAKQENQRGYNKIFEKTPDNLLYKINNEESWSKMEYKQIAAPTGIGGGLLENVFRPHNNMVGNVQIIV